MRMLPPAVLVATVLSLAAAGSATAATVEIAGSEIVYTAGPGEANRLHISYESTRCFSLQMTCGRMHVEDPGVTMTSATCQIVPRHGAHCYGPSFTDVRAALGDGTDTLAVSTSGGLLDPAQQLRYSVDAGSGNDGITTGGQDDVIDLGLGVDTFSSGLGNDDIRVADGVRDGGGNCSKGKDSVLQDTLDAGIPRSWYSKPTSPIALTGCESIETA